MKKQELLEEIVKLDIEVSENFPHYDLVDKEAVLALINQLEEPEITLNDVIARLDGLEKENRLSWISKIMHSFKIEYNDSKWKSEYEQLWINSYEVEKEKRYRVTFNLTEWNDEVSELEEYNVFLALDVTSDETLLITSRDGIRDYRTDLTEFEIKAIDERYWAFVEEVME